MNESSGDTAHPYSTVRTEGIGGAVWGFASGVLPYQPGSDVDLITDPDTAPRRAFDLLLERLGSEGFSASDVVRVTVYVVDINWLPNVNAAFTPTFDIPRPARTTVEVRALPRNSGIEIDATAVRANG